MSFDPKLGYEILDPTTDINRKPHLILKRRQDGALAPGTLHVHGAITAIANHQKSNRDDKFGYLMRHPTGTNQIGDTVSGATIHSAQLGFTGTLGDWLTGHAMLLFDPEQSFGAGINTDLERNQVQVRHACALFADLDRSPVYASLGKQAVPFGLTDTVSPFTASTTWHAFGALANTVTLTAFDLGAKYRIDSGRGPLDISAESSRFEAGPDGAPWERQDQIVLGAASFARPSPKLFAEYVRSDGYAPLNFISGGSIRNDRGELIPDRTHTDRSAHSNLFLIGANLAL